MGKLTLMLSAVAGMIALGGIFVWRSSDEGSVDEKTELRVGGTVPDKGAGPKIGRRFGGVKPTKRQEVRGDVEGRLGREPKTDLSDEALFTIEQKQLLDEIRRALDRDDRSGLIRIVQKMQKSNAWPDGIPVTLRKTAIEALSWFGRDCIPEILGFIGDPEADVRQDAIEAYEQSLFEANGDRELSQLLIAAAKVIDDAEAMDMMMMTFSDMRPSRQVETIKEIWKSGTQGAKQALKGNIEFVTGEEGINTPEMLDEWYNDPSGDNKDADDAEDFYGPWKD